MKEKYSAFARHDLAWLSYVAVIFTNVIFLPRFILAWSIMAVWSFFCIPMMWGAPVGEPIEKWRYNLISGWV